MQCVEAGVAEMAAEMALRPVASMASRDWFVLLIVSVLVKVPPV